MIVTTSSTCALHLRLHTHLRQCVSRLWPYWISMPCSFGTILVPFWPCMWALCWTWHQCHFLNLTVMSFSDPSASSQISDDLRLFHVNGNAIYNLSHPWLNSMVDTLSAELQAGTLSPSVASAWFGDPPWPPNTSRDPRDTNSPLKIQIWTCYSWRPKEPVPLHRKCCRPQETVLVQSWNQSVLSCVEL